MALTLALSLALTNFSIKPAGALLLATVAAALAGTAYYNARRTHRYAAVAMFVFGSAAQLFLITALMTPLTYVAAALDLPMQDASLAAFDRALGLDWRGYLAFFNNRPWLVSYLALGYMLIAWPVFGVPVLLGATRRFGAIAAVHLRVRADADRRPRSYRPLVPALGAYQQLGLSPSDYAHITPGGYLDQLRDFPRVRDGSLRALDLVASGRHHHLSEFSCGGLRALSVGAVGDLVDAADRDFDQRPDAAGDARSAADIISSTCSPAAAVAVLAIAAAKGLAAWLTQNAVTVPANARASGHPVPSRSARKTRFSACTGTTVRNWPTLRGTNPHGIVI